MNEDPSDNDADADRRAFLRTSAGVAVPSAMVMLLSTSLASPAIAASGGVVPRGPVGGGGGGHGGGGPGPFLGVFGLAAAGETAAVQSAAPGPIFAAASSRAPAATEGAGGGAPAPVAAGAPAPLPITPPPGEAPGPLAAAPMPPGIARTAKPRAAYAKPSAMSRAGERG